MKSQVDAYRTGRFLVKQFFRRNKKYLKTTSSGNDLVIYCGHTEHRWSPETAGFGGSEEAVIYLARGLTKIGWQVTVYNNCGHRPLADAGVIYRPFWEFNPRDKQDVVILWRPFTIPLDLKINADKLFVDVHDSFPDRTFTDRGRSAKISRFFFKSPFHRSQYPGLPDEKAVVIPNGIDFSFLENDEAKDPYLLINTSSADRSMSVLPKLFREVKRRVPQARLQWSYGWNLFLSYGGNHPEAQQWMQQTQREMDEASIETLGHLTPAEVGKLYQRACIFAYPTDFPENDCISVKKAQACGCVPVTTDAGALTTSVQFGVKLPCKQSRERQRYGIEDEETQRHWIDATVDLLNNPRKRAELAAGGMEWARQFSWPRIAARWDEVLRS